MKTTGYYKRLLERAFNARAAIEKAESDYQGAIRHERELYDDGMVGEKMLHLHTDEFTSKRDREVDAALSWIDGVADEFGSVMEDLGRLDGSRIDDNVMRLLNSGIRLTTGEWQGLANDCKDSYTMTRILKSAYAANKLEEDGDVLTFVQFGQSPQDKQKIFNKFAGLIKHTCRSGIVLDGYVSRKDYWNDLAKSSIREMQPFSDENFDSVDADFPVEKQSVISTSSVF